MDLDGESYVEAGEPDLTTATKAIPFVEQTYGANHPLTKGAHQEVVRMQALEESKVQDEPILISMGRVACRLAKLEAKLGRQADLSQQAKDELEQAEQKMAKLAATTATIEAEFRVTKA